MGKTKKTTKEMLEAKRIMEDTYRARQNEVGILLDILIQEVKAAAAEQITPNWGTVGDQEEIAKKLKDLIKMMLCGRLGLADAHANYAGVDAFVEKMLEGMIEDSGVRN